MNPACSQNPEISRSGARKRQSARNGHPHASGGSLVPRPPAAWPAGGGEEHWRKRGDKKQTAPRARWRKQCQMK